MNLLSFYTKFVVLAEEDAGWWYTTIVEPIKNGIQSIFDWVFDTAIGNFIQTLFMFIGLFLTSIFYSVLASCYKVFQLVCSLNSNTLSGYFAGISHGLTAVVIVIVAYNLAVTIIKYLVNPDEAKKSSPKMLRDIFVTAALLLSFNFIISVVNELTLLALGNQTNYTFPILSEIVEIDSTPDNGIVNRLIFGNTNGGDIGEGLACSLLELNIQDANEECSLEYIKSLKSWDKAKEVGMSITVSGFFLVGLIIAGIMIWNMLKMCCAIVVRMFKLILLQIIAPIAIVSILIDGMEKDSTFRKFVKSYFSVVIEVFVRLFSTLIVIVFIIKFMQSGAMFIPEASETAFLPFLLLVGVAAWGAFTFLNVAPAFIDETLGTKINSSFGNIGNGLLGAMAGMAAGWNKVKANRGNIFDRMSGALQGAGDGYDDGKRRAPALTNLNKAWGDGESAGKQAGLDAMERSAWTKQMFSHIPGFAGFADEKTMNGLNKELEEIEEKLKDINEDKIDDLGEVVTEGRTSLENKKKELVDQKTSIEAEIASNQSVNSELSTRISDLNQKIHNFDSQIKELEDQIASGAANVPDLQNKIQQIETDKQQAIDTKSVINSQITANEQVISKDQVKLQGVESNIKSVEADLSRTDQEYQQLTGRQSEINKNKAGIAHKVGYQKRHWTKDNDSDKKSTEQKLLDEMKKFNRK